MSNIDFTQMIDAEAKQTARAGAARDAAREECRRRILAVLDETAQLNLTAAAAAGTLPAAALETYRAGLQWIGAMRAAWPAVAGDPAGADWPPIPAGLTELAAQF